MIFITSIDGELLITSKHAIGNRHAQVGGEWLDRHLAKAGKSRKNLADFLSRYNVTAAFELADDDFEEHVLEYPPERRGLHLHGINENTIEFRTWTQKMIGNFPEEFGFHRVGVILVDTMEQVKTITDKCASTGTYESRPIEGFVVRCRQKAHGNYAEEDFFFKVKFDVPYLMYREWREVTRHLLNKKGHGFEHYRYELTTEYVRFINEKLKSHPELFERYGQGIGQIALRKLFMEENGIDKPEIAAMAMTDIGRKEDSHEEGFGANKTLLIPIGFIGCGKTTIGLVLGKLYGFGHVQNDNIAGKNTGERFHNEILLAFNRHDTVYADRNNHLRQHRSTLCKAIAAQYPECRMVTLNWPVAPAQVDDILNMTAKRVEDRGENHQSLTPQRTRGYRNILRDFLVRRDELDQSKDGDGMIDQVILLTYHASIKENLLKIISGLSLPCPSESELDQAIEYAMTFRPNFVKQVKQRNEPVMYYGVSLGPPIGDSIKEKLAVVFSSVPDPQQETMKHFVERMPGSHHITLVFCGKDKALSKDTPKEAKKEDETKRKDATGQVKQRLTQLYKDLIANNDKIKVQVCVSKLIWNERILCMPLEWIHDEQGDNVEVENTIPHVTLATSGPEVKAFEANLLLKAISEGNTDFLTHEFAACEFTGQIEEFRRSVS